EIVRNYLGRHPRAGGRGAGVLRESAHPLRDRQDRGLPRTAAASASRTSAGSRTRSSASAPPTSRLPCPASRGRARSRTSTTSSGGSSPPCSSDLGLVERIEDEEEVPLGEVARVGLGLGSLRAAPRSARNVHCVELASH